MKAKDIENQDDEWMFFDKHLSILASKRSLKHQQSIKEIVDFFYDEELVETPLTENPELEWDDIFEAWVGCLLAIHKVALEEEEYIILSKIDKAFETQTRIIEAYINNVYEGEAKIERNIWIETVHEYFNITKQETITNKQN